MQFQRWILLNEEATAAFEKLEKKLDEIKQSKEEIFYPKSNKEMKPY